MKLEVGKLFEEGKTRYQEGIKFDVDNSSMNLFVFFNKPTEKEILEIQKGDFKFGFYKESNVILTLFKFGNLKWMDAPYSIHLSKNLTKLQGIEDGKGYGLNIYLIDAETGILKCMRLIGLKTKISEQLKEAIEEQDVNLNRIYNKYSTRMLVSMGTMML